MSNRMARVRHERKAYRWRGKHGTPGSGHNAMSKFNKKKRLHKLAVASLATIEKSRRI